MDEIIDDFRENPGNEHNYLFNAGWFLFGCIAAIGFIFKMLHWPGGYQMVLIGFAGLSSHSMIYALFKAKAKYTRILFSLLPLIFFLTTLTIFSFYIDFMSAFFKIFCMTFVLSYLVRN
jgi:hypothetical protein